MGELCDTHRRCPRCSCISDDFDIGDTHICEVCVWIYFLSSLTSWKYWLENLTSMVLMFCGFFFMWIFLYTGPFWYWRHLRLRGVCLNIFLFFSNFLEILIRKLDFNGTKLCFCYFLCETSCIQDHFDIRDTFNCDVCFWIYLHCFSRFPTVLIRRQLTLAVLMLRSVFFLCEYIFQSFSCYYFPAYYGSL